MDFLQKNLENLKEDNVGKREIVAKEYILIEPNDYQYSSTNVLGYRGKSRRR